MLVFIWLELSYPLIPRHGDFIPEDDHYTARTAKLCSSIKDYYWHQRGE